MRNLDEIKQTSGMIIKKEGVNGFGGTIFPIEYKNGKVKIINNLDKALHFIFSWGMGFEHLSVSTPIRTPSWDQMCFMKDIFWKDDEVCMQLHPKKEDYVNNMPYCLHIWRPIHKEIPTPPNVMVGIKGRADFEKLNELIEEIKGEPSK